MRRRTQKRLQLFTGIFIVLTFIIAFFLIIETRLKPTIISLSQTQAKWKATEAIHSAILENISTRISYKDMVNIETNSEGEVIFIQANIVLANKIASEAILEAQKVLKELQTEELYIPLGQVTGSKLFANLGPKIGVKIYPVGTVELNVKDDFKEAGINQTRHKIYLEVSSDIQIVVPFIKTVSNIKTDVPIADTIIVGPVPERYFGGMTLDIGASAPVGRPEKM